MITTSVPCWQCLGTLHPISASAEYMCDLEHHRVSDMEIQARTIRVGDIVRFAGRPALLRVVSISEAHAVCSLGLEPDAPRDTFEIARLEKCVSIARVEVHADDPDRFTFGLEAVLVRLSRTQ